MPATVLTGWQLLISAVPTAVGALALGDGRWFVPSWQTDRGDRLHRAGADGIGNVAWFSIVGMLPANVAGLSSIMVPVVAMVSGALVHGEPLGPPQWARDGCAAGRRCRSRC